MIESSKPNYNNIALYFKKKPEHLEIKFHQPLPFFFQQNPYHLDAFHIKKPEHFETKFHQPQLFFSTKSLPVRCILHSKNVKKKPEHLEIKFHQPQLFFILTNKMHSLSETPFAIHFDVFPHKILHVFVHKCGKK